MLDVIANALYLGFLTTTQVSLLTVGDVPKMPLHTVAQVEFKPQTTIFSENFRCRYSGITVPFERDWEEVTENTFTHSKTVNPPELGKTYKYAILVNKKSCPGKPVEHMFSTGTYMAKFSDAGVPDDMLVVAIGLNPEADKQPQWFQQVMKAVQDAAGSNAVAKDFLDFNASGVPKDAVAKQSKKEDAQPGAEQANKAN
ncbi:chain length determinant protein tyrosine kinase EpsG [Novimethylophilus kurashikiensis]|uniref:Chain length determinant protein tyrosine kinase EpsG n=1 Tax=Novimethylophilus kurashikiensis TaxID=1825523 RepID=A0A2R5FC37_9PROT|nr:hypothetical protein [Novimethylophilus kurashikiensis]GBG14493.1 chain length determinant protein tyrosine kinase EpsG [Novimethylophilus kurashikiensis]